TFAIDVLETIRANRGALVAAALTVLRAWQVARQSERVGLSSFGSFEVWSRRIREPLVWLGQADPCDTIIKVRERDPMRSALNSVLLQWKAPLGVAPYTVQSVISYAVNVVDFQTALVSVAGNRSGILVSNHRLGRWLSKVEGRVLNGLALTRAGTREGYPLWQVLPVP